MLNLRLVIFWLILTLLGCIKAPKSEPESTLLKFYPSKELLSKGVVNKYYVHYDSIDKNRKTTHIVYKKYLMQDNQLVEIDYNAGFEITASSVWELADSSQKIINTYDVENYDTIYPQISDSIYFDLNNPNLKNTETVTYPKYDVTINIANQDFKYKDTSINNQLGLLIYFQSEIERVSKEKKDTFNWSIQSTILENYGLYSRISTGEKGINKYELVEQMSIQRFEKLANHGVHKIGFIDPTNTLDKDSKFTTCNNTNQIYEYYNGYDKIAQYSGGKKPLWAVISKHLDSKKLHNESGYLTYRFVVNCKGQIGWFIKNEVDLNYKRKVFHPETSQHFFEIISQLKSWSPCFVKDEPVDAYVFITIKLKDGKIIELLP